jgi:hypothetical protein
MMQWTGADRELAHSLLLARHFQITSIEFEVFRLRSSSMLGAALQFCVVQGSDPCGTPVRLQRAARRSRGLP